MILLHNSRFPYGFLHISLVSVNSPSLSSHPQPTYFHVHLSLSLTLYRRIGPLFLLAEGYFFSIILSDNGVLCIYCVINPTVSRNNCSRFSMFALSPSSPGFPDNFLLSLPSSFSTALNHNQAQDSYKMGAYICSLNQMYIF